MIHPQKKEKRTLLHMHIYLIGLDSIFSFTSISVQYSFLHSKNEQVPNDLTFGSHFHFFLFCHRYLPKLLNWSSNEQNYGNLVR